MKKNIGILLLIAFLVLEIATTTINAHREHKVHNIVLYPDKHSWCKTLAIKQVVSYPGCKSEEIDNNVCVGTCFSYSIPHTEPSNPGEVIVPYCDSCQPSDTTWHHVTLECTKNSLDSPPQLVKRVQIINNCSCSSCEKSYISTHSNNFEDDENDLIMSHHDVPDVLKILNRNESKLTIANNVKVKDLKSIVNHKIVTLLKNIQENNSVHDKEQLMDLLRMIQGPNSKLNDKTIEDFVESLHSENIELDIPKLREILIKFERSKLYEKHKKYFEGNHNDDDSDIHSDDVNENGYGTNHHLASPPLSSSSSSLSPSISVVDDENQPILDENDEDDDLSKNSAHMYVSSSSTSQSASSLSSTSSSPSAPLSISPSLSSSSSEDDNNQNGNGKHHHQHHTHHHHHHIGENIVGQGHLTRGPHGALVIEPERIHEKLDVNPHELKPNHAGTLLSYSGHSTDNRKP